VNSAPKRKRRPLLSPFRYPGGKTWLLPIIRQWLQPTVDCLVEPFAGSGIVSLAALDEKLARRAVLTERDRCVAAVWHVMLNGDVDWFCRRIRSFNVTRESVEKQLRETSITRRERAWMTLLRNRVSHGGLIAPGAGLLNRGEAGNGVTSRWYPKTLSSRVRRIHRLRRLITFKNCDAMKTLRLYINAEGQSEIAFFIDPPYSVAGKRMYKFGEINHSDLFEIASRLPGRVLMTYDDTRDIRELTRKHGFEFRRVAMRSRHHVSKSELLIAKDFAWLKTP
jgi:DNA adenine methylase